MAKFVSRRAPVSVASLKRRWNGAVVLLHSPWEDVKFSRVHGGWRRSRTDVTSERPVVVSSVVVARECNTAVGCKESWARVY